LICEWDVGGYEKFGGGWEAAAAWVMGVFQSGPLSAAPSSGGYCALESNASRRRPVSMAFHFSYLDGPYQDPFSRYEKSRQAGRVLLGCSVVGTLH
jgi:hypothetical protein